MGDHRVIMQPSISIERLWPVWLLYTAWNALNIYKLEQIINVYPVDLAKLVMFFFFFFHRMQLRAERWMLNELDNLSNY